ncbi:MAG: response regulator, partial [Phycisphaerae bacterium]|nr:response regulator [Phycisphaerae bacterium]
MRVLVVDDSVVIRRLLTKFIESDGTMKVVDSARDGQQALDKIQELAPDVVTLDVEMPVMDGLGVLARLRTLRPELRPAVLMCSTLTAAGSTHALEA